MRAVVAPPSGYGPSIPEGDAISADSRLMLTIVACVAAARENARQAREQISSEMWEQLNRLYLSVRQPEQSLAAPFYTHVKEAAHLFNGVTDSTMIHAEGWHYIQIGRSLERAAATATMIEMHFDGAQDHGKDRDIGSYISWTSLLRSCSGFEAYCQRYTADVKPERVVEFLLLSPDFPRSVRFAIDTVEASLRAIARGLGRSSTSPVDRLAGRLRASLDYSQIDEIMADSLQGYVQGIRKQCDLVHGALYQTYISYLTETAIA